MVAKFDDRGAIYGFEYDARDRLTAAIDAEGRRIDYGYDAAGNRTHLRTPSSTVEYDHDALNRLTEVVARLAGQPAAQQTRYTYDAVGNRSGQTHANGSTVSYQYDRRNRLSTLVHRTAAGVLLLGLSYQVDASGLRTGIVETQAQGTTLVQTRSASYGYDAHKRLTQSSVSGSTSSQTLNETFSYDAVGNRLSRVCMGQIRTCTGGLSSSSSIGTVTTLSSYDSNDRLTREQWGGNFSAVFDSTYDAAGNLLSKKQGTTTLASYTWDIENRLIQATLTPTTGSTTISRYQYDGNGIRRIADVLTQTSTSTTRTRSEYLIDPNQAYAQVLEDWTATATEAGLGEPALPDASLQTHYVYGDDLIAQATYSPLPPGEVGANAPGEGGNDPLARIGAPTGTRIVHVDGLGSTRLLTAHSLDAAGQPITTGTIQSPANETVTDRYAYSAFGDTDQASTSAPTGNTYRYTGEQLDPNLGWYYLRARYMNPGQGRFVGMDPFAGVNKIPSSLHRFMYGANDPISQIDPSGLTNLAEVQSAGAGLSSLSLRTISTVTFNTARVAANDALWSATAGASGYAAAGLGLITSFALTASAQKRDRFLGTPVIVFGREFSEHAQHISDAQRGDGSNFRPAPFALNRISPWDRGWLRAASECNAAARARAGGSRACDEYPFASSRQGGPVNYVAQSVSLRLLSRSESDGTRNFIRDFYSVGSVSNDGFSKRSRFIVVGIPEVRSFYTDRAGMVHYLRD